MEYIDTDKRFTTISGRRRVGAVVRFSYNGTSRMAIVLDPGYDNKMHAIQLDTLTAESLIDLLNDIQKSDTYESLRERFMRSPYSQDRAYRTFLITKISGLEEVVLVKSK